MKHIASRDNPLYRQLRALAGGSRKGGQLLIEGPHLCQAWLDTYGLPVIAVFDEARLARPDLASLADAVRGLAPAARIALASGMMDALEDAEHGQGVMFVVEPPALPSPRGDVAALWLDRVQDPGNVGTLLRLAAAAGLQQVVLSNGCAHAWSPKVLRSAQGAHFSLQIIEKADLAALRPTLSVPLLATALDGSEDLFDTELPRTCVWLFGHEGRGVCEELLQLADKRVRIAHAPAVESLNVAAAAAICLFEQRRRFRCA